MFGWFKRKPIEPVVVEPAVRPETTEERKERLAKYDAERAARLEKLDALDRRGETIKRGDTIWHNGQEMAIFDAYSTGRTAQLYVAPFGVCSSSTWSVGSGAVVKLPNSKDT